MPLSIALDGPVGAGKSSIADEAAKKLGILHLDTGAMYRAVGLLALRSGVDPHDGDAVAALASQAQIAVAYGPAGQITRLNGEDVSGLIRTEAVGQAASAVAAIPQVRALMVALQQRLAAETDMIVDGRDIGTRVLPRATVKIYLTATAEERAHRRWLQLKEKGVEADEQTVLADLLKRDAQDMNRETDPLRQAEDAVVLDSTRLTFEETTAELVRIVREAVSANA